MKIKVRVPLSFQRFTSNKAELECRGDTFEEILADLISQYNDIKEMIYDEEGRIRSSLSLFLNGKIVRMTKEEKILLNDNDEILIMQLIAGG